MKCETGRIHAKKRYSSGFIMIYTVTVSLFGLTPDCGSTKRSAAYRFHRNFTYPLSDLIACDVFTLGR